MTSIEHFDPRTAEQKVAATAELKRLARLLRAVESSWALAVYEHGHVRDLIITELRATLEPLPVMIQSLARGTTDPLALLKALPDQPAAPVVCFTEVSNALRSGLGGLLDLQRESLRQLPHRLVFWVTEYDLRVLANQSPNFYSRINGIFRFPGTIGLDVGSEFQNSAVTIGDVAGGAIVIRDKDERQRLIAQQQRRIDGLAALGADAWDDLAESSMALGRLYAEATPRQWSNATGVYRQAANTYAQLHQPLAQAQALVEAGNAAHGNYELPQARAYLQQALELFRATGDQQGEARVLQLLGNLFYTTGDYAAAQPLYERALAIREQVLGPQHPDTATSLNNLAALLDAMDDYAAARLLYERALTIQEQVLGSQHPDIVIGLTNLAALLAAMKNYIAAQPLYERALAIQEQTLGPYHPATALSLNNLAGLLDTIGDYAAARPLYERSLAIREQVFGPNHPATATSLNNLAELLRVQGDYAAARPLYERALAINEAVYGSQHPATATSLNNLAALLDAMGEDTAARPLYERAFAIRQQVLGSQPPSVDPSLDNADTRRSLMPFSHGHALLIGVGSYAHAPQLNVPITAADATAVAAVLRDPQFCGYPPARVTLLRDGTATRAAVLAALDTLAQRVGPDDIVTIFYAGHGEYGDDGYYLTTHDTRLAGRKVAAGAGLREAELIAKLRAIPAQRLLLIVNACHAGELSPVLAPGAEPLTGAPLSPQVSAALLSTGAGRVIISACRERQYAFIGPGPLTLFTQALVDGLQGKGVSSNHGYISVFDLYTHLYFALDEAVAQQIPADVRHTYGDQQEPELTILKGVGPFAVALYRGATTLGDFDAAGSPPEGTAVREVKPAYAQAMLRQHLQQIGDNAQVGAAVAGDVHGDVQVTQQDQRGQRGGINFGSGGQFGDITIGDVAGRDIIKGDVTLGDRISTGDISGSGIAIGRGARSNVRNIDTGGGNYAEGNIDKRRGSFVSGDQFTMSGNFSGAILNIKSTLSNVAQSIGAAPHGAAATKAQLQTLIAQLSAELTNAPAEQASAAEAVAEMAKQAVEHATQPQPNQTLVQISAAGLKQAAQNLAVTLPTVLPLAERIAEVIRRMVGG